jgi:hypothetical protein
VIGGYLRRTMPTTFGERRTLSHDGELHLLEARRGRGKSYGLTWWAREAVFRRVPVRANFDLSRYRLAVQGFMHGTFPTLGAAMEWTHANVHYIGHWDELLTAHDCVMLLDEISRNFDSRNRTAPGVAFEYFQQSRKLGMTLVLASQSFDWLDVRIRQLADVLWMVRKEQAKGADPAGFWWYGLDPWASGLTETVMRDRADYVVRLPFRKDVATLYNTRELIRILSGTPSWANMGELTDWFLERGAMRDGVGVGGTRVTVAMPTSARLAN